MRLLQLLLNALAIKHLTVFFSLKISVIIFCKALPGSLPVLGSLFLFFNLT